MDGTPSASPTPTDSILQIIHQEAIILIFIVIIFVFAILGSCYGIITRYFQQLRRLHQRPPEPISVGLPPPPPDDPRIKEMAAGCTECVICLGEYAGDGAGVMRRTIKPCGHRFHKICIDAWLRKERRGCPICCGVFGDSSVSVNRKLSGS